MTRFDRFVLITIAVLVLLIGATIALGDRVGVTLARVSPLGEARSTSPISLQFSETMAQESVAARFRTEPEMGGDFRWSGSTLTFQPAQAIPPGQTVTVTLERGAVSETGRAVLSDYQFTFTVRSPQVAYLYPSNGNPVNIWTVDPMDPTTARQITFSPSGIYDYSVSPDGTQIAFSENNSNTGTNDLKLLNLDTGGLVQITNCADASCVSPVWRPDGSLIAYERTDFNSDMAGQGIGNSPRRVWLVDTTVVPASTRPLFSELQVLGYAPQWSAGGNRIGIYDSANVAVLVRDLTDGSTIAVPSRAGSGWALSPDGSHLAYSDYELVDNSALYTLRLANLNTNEQLVLTDPDDFVVDARMVWRPDGQMLAVARRDETQTRGYQVYLVDPVTGDSTPLTDDPRYSNMFFWWDATGRYLVMQRFPELDENMQPNNSGVAEIWTLDTETRELTKVVENGFVPHWIP